MRHCLVRAFAAAAMLACTCDRMHANTLVVDSAADNTIAGDAHVTLREAIIAANDDTTTDLGQTGAGIDTIILAALGGMIELQDALPAITSTIRIRGPGQHRLEIRGSSSFSETAHCDCPMRSSPMASSPERGDCIPTRRSRKLHAPVCHRGAS